MSSQKRGALTIFAHPGLREIQETYVAQAARGEPLVD